MNETAPRPPHRGPLLLAVGQALALAADVALIAAGIVVARYLERQFNPHVGVLSLGCGLALVSIAAGWLALGPLSTAMRLVAAPLVCLGALLLTAIVLHASGARPQAIAGSFVAGIAQFLLLQAPYWLLRIWQRLRIVHLRELEASGPVERLQYNLWQMLLVMTLVALAMGIGRGIFAISSGLHGLRSNYFTLAIFFVLLVGYNLLIAWPLLWAVLSPTGGVWKGSAAIVIVAGVVIVAFPLTSSILGTSEGPWIYACVFVPQPAFLLTHLAAARISGCRLVVQGA